MGDPAKRRATCEDLRRDPDHLVAELFHGTLVTLIDVRKALKETGRPVCLLLSSVRTMERLRLIRRF